MLGIGLRTLALLATVGSGALLLSGPEVSAQDGHYWTEFYGTRSTILNGVVIGSVDDLAAVYYNPARLAVMDNPWVILSGKVYEWSHLEIEDALGEGLDLSESAFGGVPTMAAGTFRLPFWPKHRFGYAYLIRYRSGTDLFVRDERRAEVVEVFPGDELFDQKLFWKTEVKEEWFGLSWAYPVTERVSVGLTGFYADRGKELGSDLRLTALSEDGRVAQWIRNRAVGYSASGFLGKFGIAADLSPLSLGLTVTTPKLNVRGDGHFVYEDILNGLDQDQDGADDDRFETSLQKDLPAEHHWPWSVGAGAGLTMGKHMLHLSTEWFGPVSRYTLVEAEDFVGQTTGDTLSYRIVDDLKSVINFGVGYEYFFNDRFSAHLSFATDYSAVRPDESPSTGNVQEIDNSTFKRDFFHYGGGASLTFSAVEFTLGATYTTAAQEIRRTLGFPEGGGSPSPHGGTTTIRANRVRFLFGFELFFLQGLRERAGAG